VGEWVEKVKEILPMIKCQPCNDCDEEQSTPCPHKEALRLPSGKIIEIAGVRP
jgi:hypothetical protein